MMPHFINNRIVILGDWISDVYIDNTDITPNQEIIDKVSYKGKYDNILVYPGGTGFLIENLLKLVNGETINDIVYLLPKVEDSVHDEIFNFKDLFYKSIKYISNYNIDYFTVKLMEPIDFIHDIIKPTVKIRFYSSVSGEVYFRFDHDNNIELKNINCNNLFSTATNDIIIIDYDKGYFNKKSIDTLFDTIYTNNIKINNLFLNTKPANLELYTELLNYLYKDVGCNITIQLNEYEFEPVKDILLSNEISWSNIIVTRGKNDIHLYDRYKPTYTSIDISDAIIDDVHTTSGCGDVFLANVIYYNLYHHKDILESILITTKHMKNIIYDLNKRIFS